ncbi:PREDICTED: uncharacterized protein LOC109177135 [Ipomoea nil]|uniref:uncharacterized protein LOC109177135 n=1 Tax=Ipomoea nil TaxID=35883 RepID=UPI000901D3AE|nr:PREDICTED: uncharacterized protein LOC109177135 [Ipomoea nil]
MEVEPTCPMCGLHPEDTMHALVSCVYARAVRSHTTLPSFSPPYAEFPLWFEGVLTNFSSDNIMLAAAVLYHKWRARNRAVWEAALPSPRAVATAATATLQAWRLVHASSPQGHPHSTGTLRLVHGHYIAAFNSHPRACLSFLH